jgi:ADP-ribosylglycohydrolase
MPSLQITREQYRDKVHGGWLGKNAGGTLGAGMEGKEIRSVQFYDPLPGQPAASDGLDFQFVWLNTLRDVGPNLTSDDLGDRWEQYIKYAWDEYGWSSANLRRGLRAPISGSFNNWFRTSNRAVGRCDIWGLTAPGSPQIAATYAYNDARIDHTGEGVWAAMFWAAMESAAFFDSDPASLVGTGLAMIPASCKTAQAVRAAVEASRGDVTLLEARTRILAAVGSDNYADAPQNVGLAVTALLFGKGDFGASISNAVSLGYATQINAAAVGALVGIMRGKNGLPVTWIQPLGDAAVLGWGVVGLDVERTTTELVEHTTEAGERVVAEKCSDVALVDKIEVPPVPPPVEQAAAVAVEPAAGPGVSMAADQSAVEAPTEGPRIPSAPPAGFVIPGTANPDAAPAVADGVAERIQKLELDQPAETTDDDEPTVREIPLEADAQTTESLESSAVLSGAEPQQAVPVIPTVVETPPAVIATPVPSINWLANNMVQPLWNASSNTALYGVKGFEITVDYGDAGPAIIPNTATTIVVAIRNLSESDFIGHVTLGAPAGWQVAVPGAQGQRQMLAKGGMARYGFVLRAPDTVSLMPRNMVAVVLTPENATPISADVPLLGGSCWWFVGPFRNMADEGFDRAYEPEDKPGIENEYLARDGGLVKWQQLAFKENVMNLETLLNGYAGVVYGQTALHVASITEARIVTHTNDGVKVWLNDQRILLRHSHEPFRPSLAHAPASADVTLKAGDNKVMVKVVRCGAPMEFAFTVTDRDGKPLDDVGNTRW